MPDPALALARDRVRRILADVGHARIRGRTRHLGLTHVVCPRIRLAQPVRFTDQHGLAWHGAIDARTLPRPRIPVGWAMEYEHDRAWLRVGPMWLILPLRLWRRLRPRLPRP